MLIKRIKHKKLHQLNNFISTGFKLSLLVPAIIYDGLLPAQINISLTDLSFFQTPGARWRLADVVGDLIKSEVLTTINVTGVLVNLPDKTNPGRDWCTNLQKEANATSEQWKLT